MRWVRFCDLIVSSMGQEVSLLFCLPVFRSVCQTFGLSLNLLLCLSVFWSVCQSFDLSVNLLVCLSVFWSAGQSFGLPFNLLVRLSVFVSVCQSFGLSVSLLVCLSAFGLFVSLLCVCQSFGLSVSILVCMMRDSLQFVGSQNKRINHWLHMLVISSRVSNLLFPDEDDGFASAANSHAYFPLSSLVTHCTFILNFKSLRMIRFVKDITI